MTQIASVVLWRDIHYIADRVCKEFGLSYGKLVPCTSKLSRCYGSIYACDKCRNAAHINEVNCNEKVVNIRTHQLKNKNKPLSTSTILRTLAHELAHLQEWTHGPAHKRVEKEILKFIRSMGYEA